MVAPGYERERNGHPDLAGPEAVNGSEASGDTRRLVSAGRGLRLLRKPTTGAFLGTVVIYIFFAIFAGGNGFLGLGGTATWADTAAELGIVALPIGLLMIGGEFDLSVGSVIGLGTITASICTTHYHWPLLLAVLFALFLAAIVGLINGIVTVKTGLPSFIVTLATYLAVDGGTLYTTQLLNNNTTVSLQSSGWLHSALAGSVHQFNVSILWWIGMTIVAAHILTRTVFGNWIAATGGDKEAARGAGVPTDRVKVTLFVVSAVCAALLGVIQAMEYNGGAVGQGQSYIFYSIIAAVVGGVLLQGGYGSALGVLFGAATYGIVSTGIYYTGWDSNLAEVILGLLLLVAVLSNNFFRRLATRG